ncbi:MAG: relaxase domain-containing protein [Planctomycetes bacterium]|nr:relaxase domain-containing protein [Planctomycetota bacterium]
MLRITQNQHAAGAMSYYSTADYYSEGQELTGYWRGEAARRLGLTGEIRKADWDALCQNEHPQTHNQLTPRTKSNRTVGYDFNFHVPKSVSLLYAATKDERLLEAFRDSVQATMEVIESEMRTRVRLQGKNEDRITGNAAWGEFVHLTSRPVGGIPDPHLHAHCFVFSATFDKQEERWKAGQFRELKRDAGYFEALFHARLADRLSRLGLPITRTKKSWELAGINREFIEKFSRRTTEITEEIKEKEQEKGPLSVEEKAEIGARTRSRKQKDLPFSELQSTWRSWMTGEERDALVDLERKLGGEAEPRDEGAAGKALDHAISHAFERKSVVPERQVLAHALRQGVGQASVEEVLREAAASDLIVGDRDGRRMATTRNVLLEEVKVVNFARSGRGVCDRFAAPDRPFERHWLNDDQKQAVRHVLGSRDRVTVVRGAAGVGKTTLMQEVVAAIEQEGTKVYAFAPSAAASRGVLRSEGFAADTVARLLVDEKLQAEMAGQLIWVDEAGLMGTRTMAQVFDLAEKLDARVLLTGDRRQHGSVERGAALRLLEEEAGLKPAEVKQIQRQQGEYKEAVKALSEGRAGEGFDRLDKLGWVKEVPEDDRYQVLASDYVSAVASGKTALVVSPTHAEAQRIDHHIREELRQANVLGTDERTFTVLQNSFMTEAERSDKLNYHYGDVLQYHQNAKGHVRGDRLAVAPGVNLPVDQAARFQVFRTKELKLAPGDVIRITHNGKTADDQHRLDNGALYRIKNFDQEGNIVLHNGWLVAKDFGHVDHGYVVTSHSSQGRTVDQVFIGQSSASFPATSREQFYVSCSRARDRVTVYTDDRESLRARIERGDDRLTATEFVNGPVHRQMVANRQRPERSLTRVREREERTYE